MAKRMPTITTDGLRTIVPGVIRNVPADLAMVVAFVGLIDLAATLPTIFTARIQLALELILVVFLPGYAMIAALFPRTARANDGASGARPTPLDRRIRPTERLGLSLGLSLAVVPLVGLLVNLTPWGLARGPILAALSLLVLVATGVAAVRRRQVPAPERFRIDPKQRLADARASLFENGTRLDTALSILLLVSVLAAAVSVAYVASMPTKGERTTQFYVLAEGEDGTLTTDNYPREFDRGDAKPVVLRIHNREATAMDYGVVVQLQRVTADNETTVVESTELDRIRVADVAHNDTWSREYGIEPTMTGENLRVAFLLFRGDIPADTSPENAYRELRLSINVTEG